jgi:hypothetical protein
MPNIYLIILILAAVCILLPQVTRLFCAFKRGDCSHNKRRYLIPCWYLQIPNVFAFSAVCNFLGATQTWIAVPLCICLGAFFLFTGCSTLNSHENNTW